MSLFKKLGLPPTVSHAIRHTRINGDTVLEANTRNKKVTNQPCTFKVGLDLITDRGKVELKSWTVEQGKHVRNFSCLLTPEGKLLSGTVNCFGYGTMAMDEDYIEELLKELEESKIKWDVIQ